VIIAVRRCRGAACFRPAAITGMAIDARLPMYSSGDHPDPRILGVERPVTRGISRQQRTAVRDELV